ncbi:hypothetical protein BDV35DRAFT_380583 [Aspergillus flavus]|uniref:RBR-type E3 ubiquitin transferase n=2 Tax=Aspergillus subgen. Circumdati TaxID=2720871 RepID=A0A5N6GVW7_ASPFL|nr:putative E3 ubiquitin ligase [Aspergillus oryzae 3.042]KAB8246482.1 hypothetical protein BDV35DRAFT_380583 [Aspergillus flavus]KDE79809.1 putative E3 ubiquitin ligase [Aspergillus oryzae 100-8]|eukprot:EIT79717.1 putative E3 ubiquitin ligase [Aspergillus oryzae 3.042]
MHEPTEELVLRLMQDDATCALGLMKGKERSDQMTDHELALTEWARELRHCACTFEDYKMAKSLATAVSHDGVALAAATEEENRAFQDRMTALQFGGLNPSTPDQLLGQKTAAMAGLTGLVGGFNTVSEQSRSTDTIEVRRSGLIETESPGAESSKVAAARNLDCQTHLKCVACMEAKLSFDIFKATCSHYYCRNCTGRLVHDSFVDESLFPPKCCRVPFPLPTMKAFLDEEMIRKFEEKTVEHNDFNRTYCANLSCSRYLPPTSMTLTTRLCPSCNTETCPTCKQRAHAGVCVNGEVEILKMAEAEGWQRCARCRNMVELKSGCNHITCRCGFEFCYVCALKWKICGCEVWDEDRLVDRAHQVAARNEGNPQPAQQEVQRAAQELREQHNCEHGRWRRRDGEYSCDVCHDLLPDFILRCQRCKIEACVRCRYNRL